MYIHLGEHTIVSEGEIITIIDLENTTISKTTRDFLRLSEQKKQVVNVSSELPRSAVVCRRQGKDTVYISQISPATLQKRSVGRLNQEELKHDRTHAKL